MKADFNMDRLVRPNIRALTPYRSARDDFEEGLLLDANENSLGSPFGEGEALNRYPDPYQKKLRQAIADWREVQPGQVFTGVGSDEAIDLLFTVFCRPGRDRIITTPPTYGMYRVSANIHDIAVDEVLLGPDLEPDTEKIIEVAGPDTKLLFLCSPNNPTGTSLPADTLRTILDRFEGVVVLDEAYIDFSMEPSMVPLIERYPNLVVLQTMSKSFGLAGIRLGMAFANREIISYLMKVKPPYNVNSLTARHALKAFDNLETLRFNVDSIRKERKRLHGELAKIGRVQKIYPSEANFLLAKIDNAPEAYKKLADRGVIVRYRGDEPRCEECLRITVGTPDENDKLIQALKDIS